MKLEKYDVWYGQYKQIHFEIRRTDGFSSPPVVWPARWTFYLYVTLDKIHDQKRASELWLDPVVDKREYGTYVCHAYSASILGGVDFHGGITFYDKESGFEGGSKIIKIGCDYMHYGDEGNAYSVEYIVADVEGAVDSLLGLIGDYGEKVKEEEKDA